MLATPENDASPRAGYAAVAALMVTIALYGHATIVAMQKIGSRGRRTAGPRRARSRTPSRPPHHKRIRARRVLAHLDLSAVLFAAAPISYGPPSVTTRGASRPAATPTAASPALAFGMFVGCAVAELVRRLHGDVDHRSTDSYLNDLCRRGAGVVRHPDRRHLAARRSQPGSAVHLRQRTGSGRVGATTQTNPDHDRHGGRPRSRCCTSVCSFDAVESVTAMTVALNAVITPWVAILGHRHDHPQL